ncbi:hypothetical protein CEP51_000305 [Fusarium floridanum]|uniref:DUF6594 domain-containing protein n=1 Tax=Fusarium floridanum TaxID=1325733 RepID=A0A428SNK9_9HYPO|nr:hypothetical protein CEP51_000305 [Fusarium floridanum]
MSSHQASKMNETAFIEDDDPSGLVSYVNRSLEDEEQFHFLRFEFLQRLNITRLGVNLVRLKSDIQRQSHATSDQSESLTTMLRDYATAVRDYEYLRNHQSLDQAETTRRKLLLQRYFQSRSDFNDPFQSHYSAFNERPEKLDPLRCILMRYLPSRLSFSHHEKRERKKEYLDGEPPKYVSEFVDRLVRFTIAITGGLFIVVPMIIMSIDESQVKSLVTVSVAVVFFALIVSFGVRVSNIETLVSTATYSAVLVVFVGTSTGVRV